MIKDTRRILEGYSKEIVRKILNYFHLDLTKNLEYDRLTKVIIKKNLEQNSNCIDIGCHKGEIMDFFLSYSPKGQHFGFEPIPFYCNKLKKKYKEKVNIYPFALSDRNGCSNFQFVKNAPAYSGIKRRKYDIKNPDIETIEVELRKLDDIIPEHINIDFIKIDVEGAEFQVLKGAQKILSTSKPIILFEFGLGASDFYGTTSDDIFALLTKNNERKIYTLKGFIRKSTPLNISEFDQLYQSKKEYYFVAK
jgi:FkbM family methyltransferase